MIISAFTEESFGVNSYILEEGNHAVLIDPIVTNALKSKLDGIKLDGAILTHEHVDHILGVNVLKKQFGTKVLCGQKAAKSLLDPSRNMSRYQEFIVKVLPFGSGTISNEDYICKADETLADGQSFQWQGHEILIKETPGHSAGSIAILVDWQYLFSGDTVFKNYPTATRLPGGSSKAFARITEPWLDSLPQELTVYPGHTEPFPLKERYRS